MYVRWYCDFEQAQQQFRNFTVLPLFVQQLVADGVCPATTAGLVTQLTAGPVRNELALQLCVQADTMTPFVRATYETETDSADAVFHLFERVQRLRTHIVTSRGAAGLPNTRALARQHVMAQHPGMPLAQLAVEVNNIANAQLQLVEPAFLYFERHTSASFAPETVFECFWDEMQPPAPPGPYKSL